jgi:hypothetical protein
MYENMTGRSCKNVEKLKNRDRFQSGSKKDLKTKKQAPGTVFWGRNCGVGNYWRK